MPPIVANKMESDATTGGPKIKYCTVAILHATLILFLVLERSDMTWVTSSSYIRIRIRIGIKVTSRIRIRIRIQICIKKWCGSIIYWTSGPQYILFSVLSKKGTGYLRIQISMTCVRYDRCFTWDGQESLQVIITPFVWCIKLSKILCFCSWRPKAAGEICIIPNISNNLERLIG